MFATFSKETELIQCLMDLIKAVFRAFLFKCSQKESLKLKLQKNAFQLNSWLIVLFQHVKSNGNACLIYFNIVLSASVYSGPFQEFY